MQQQATAPDAGEWRIWIERILLFLGTAQIIAGIFFFFAYNWDDLTRWQKLGITQGCVVLAAIGARVAGLDSLIGRLLLLAAGALVGASFAVYGQIYQTGADAFTLFERLEAKLETHPGQLTRACVELAKDWRMDRYLRRLEDRKSVV